MELFFGTILTSLVFLFCGLLLRCFPPKKINHIYGYRTRRSMASQEIWDYANNLGAKMLIYLGWVLLVISLGAYFLFPKTSAIIALFSMLIGVGIGIYWCETQLNKRFDKNGNPKNSSRF